MHRQYGVPIDTRLGKIHIQQLPCCQRRFRRLVIQRFTRVKNSRGCRSQNRDNTWPSNNSLGRLVGPSKQGNRVGGRHSSNWSFSLTQIYDSQWNQLYQSWVNDWSIQYPSGLACAQLHHSVDQTKRSDSVSVFIDWGLAQISRHKVRQKNPLIIELINYLAYIFNYYYVQIRSLSTNELTFYGCFTYFRLTINFINNQYIQHHLILILPSGCVLRSPWWLKLVELLLLSLKPVELLQWPLAGSLLLLSLWWPLVGLLQWQLMQVEQLWWQLMQVGQLWWQLMQVGQLWWLKLVQSLLLQLQLLQQVGLLWWQLMQVGQLWWQLMQVGQLWWLKLVQSLLLQLQLLQQVGLLWLQLVESLWSTLAGLLWWKLVGLLQCQLKLVESLQLWLMQMGQQWWLKMAEQQWQLKLVGSLWWWRLVGSLQLWLMQMGQQWQLTLVEQQWCLFVVGLSQLWKYQWIQLGGVQRKQIQSMWVELYLYFCLRQIHSCQPRFLRWRL